MADSKSGQIICTRIGKGRRHDFHLYKTSKVHIHQDIQVLADSGYQGLQKRHINSLIPKRASKKYPLSKEQKRSNKNINSNRVFIEHTLRKIKIFRIMAERYRNRRKRFGLRLNLIAAIINLQL